MYKRELDEKLKKKTPMHAVFLYGADAFLIGYYGNKIAQNLLESGCEKHSFYFSEFDFSSALGYFSQGSLFGGAALVWVKIDKKIPKKQLDALLEALLKAQGGFLILEFYQAENKSDAEYMSDAKSMLVSFPKSLEKEGVFSVRFFRANANESVGILREFAQTLNLQIPDFLLQKILEQQNFDLGLSVAELRKYSIFGQEINAQIIESVGYGLGRISLESILDLLFDKRLFDKRGFKENESLKIEQFLEQGFEEMELVREMQKYFFTLFLFTSHIRSCNNNLEEVLHYKPPKDVLEKRGRLAGRIGYAQYEEIFNFLNTWHEDVMCGRNKGNGLLEVLIKIQAILK